MAESTALSALITPSTILLLHNLTLFALSILTGIALSLRVWTMPLVLDAAPNTSIQIKQFNYIIALGFKYLQTSTRLFPVALAALAGMTWHLEHQSLAQQGAEAGEDATAAAMFLRTVEWWHYIAAIVPLLTAGVYEIIFIFPTNDRIDEYGKVLERESRGAAGGKNTDVDAEGPAVVMATRFGDERDEKIQKELRMWMKWHVGRIILPAMSAGIMMASSSGHMPYWGY